ncbi:GNAT family N-acetyltransferase [Bacillus sp. FJAT-42376]|uniref:GNAT family N-acetyltransferase n=1 Tax=Bacillus sp. FJAT-42376 TaxID=2014076 RepID=UPI000F4D6C01|nr:GNAT family N-acetyltransferase [Bacillus sp. FJAT-42376]AZB42140.1 GNAT family N-acetyltransferase [Bacillus sp. FJAT-42376]
MIRQLSEKDHGQCFAYISKKPAENLFLIGDIEAFGYDESFQKVWGDFDEDGELKGVLLKYEVNYIPFSYGEFDAEGFADIMKRDPEWQILSGLEEVTAKLEPYLNRKTDKRVLYYAKCNTLEGTGEDDSAVSVKKAEIDDAEKIIGLHKKIEEFTGSESIESKRRNMEKGVSRTYYVEADSMMVSAASTAAENSLSAMVVGVCTVNEHKQKGYATACMLKLCGEVLDEGRELCLFYDNPAAGKIYKRIGFKDIGMWTMYKCL